MDDPFLAHLRESLDSLGLGKLLSKTGSYDLDRAIHCKDLTISVQTVHCSVHSSFLLSFGKFTLKLLLVEKLCESFSKCKITLIMLICF